MTLRAGPAEADIDRPVFIVGCGRSGTTLLFDWLAQHPGLARTTGYPDGEDHEGWIEHGDCVIAGIGTPDSLRFGSGINGFQPCLHMTAADATPSVRERMRRYHAGLLATGAPARRVLNKCPHNSNKLDYMLGIFPGARIVHIVRDCAPMVASWMAIMQHVPSVLAYLPADEPLPCLWLMPAPASETARQVIGRHPRFHPGGAANVWVEYWCRANLGIEAQMEGRLDQLLCIRYEDLINAPARTMDEIVRFCGLPAFAFDTGNVALDTSTQHLSLLAPDIVAAIDSRASAARRHFGYLPAADGSAAPPAAARLFVPTIDHRHLRLDLHPGIALDDETAARRDRFVAHLGGLEEAMDFYQAVTARGITFPPDWEYYLILLALERHPLRPDLQQRLAAVGAMLDLHARVAGAPAGTDATVDGPATGPTAGAP